VIRRTEAEQILGEWGVRDVTPDSAAVRERLDEELASHPLKGKPLRRRYRNFTPDPAGYLVSSGGPLPYMQRLKAIEELTQAQLERLEEAWRALAAECRGEEFARRWRERVARWSFHEVNDLIARHNRWYPIESRLPMDPRTGDFVRVGGRSYRRRPLDAAWALERFPATGPA
jgi:RecB family exonuclease